MRELVRSLHVYPALAIGGALVLGVMETVALWRAQGITDRETRA